MKEKILFTFVLIKFKIADFEPILWLILGSSWKNINLKSANTSIESSYFADKVQLNS